MRQGPIWYLALAALAAFLSLTVPANAAPRSVMVGSHHLPDSPSAAAFVMSVRGGFSGNGPFVLTIYANGQLKLMHPASGRVRLRDRHLVLTANALKGLLKLAEAEGFFSMRSRIVSKKPLPDASRMSITITTQEGTKTVSVLGVNVPGFYELFSVIDYAAGITT